MLVDGSAIRGVVHNPSDDSPPPPTTPCSCCHATTSHHRVSSRPSHLLPPSINNRLYLYSATRIRLPVRPCRPVRCKSLQPPSTTLSLPTLHPPLLSAPPPPSISPTPTPLAARHGPLKPSRGGYRQLFSRSNTAHLPRLGSARLGSWLGSTRQGSLGPVPCRPSGGALSRRVVSAATTSPTPSPRPAR